MEAFFLLGQGLKRDCVKLWIMDPIACDSLLRGRGLCHNSRALHDLVGVYAEECSSWEDRLLQRYSELLGESLYHFVAISPSEIIFSDVSQCVSSASPSMNLCEPLIAWLTH